MFSIIVSLSGNTYFDGSWNAIVVFLASVTTRLYLTFADVLPSGFSTHSVSSVPSVIALNSAEASKIPSSFIVMPGTGSISSVSHAHLKVYPLAVSFSSR